MSFPKILLLISIVLFGVIGGIAFFKKGSKEAPFYASQGPIEIELDVQPPPMAPTKPIEEKAPIVVSKVELVTQTADFPEVDRIEELFNKRDPRLPIVQTIAYKSQVPWQKGRPAWVADYASHYKTSRHFIARSLNGKADYDKQDVSDGVRFNVFNENKKFEFYLLADLETRKMWFYYLDNDTGERVLLKTYKIGVGRPDSGSPSGSLTPIGVYSLGDKVAVYKPKTMGFYQGEKTEMVRIFGTRWIPFEDEVRGCSAAAKGFGIHGLPLQPNAKGELVENQESLGRYESDGCIRLSTKDIEEIFAIIITKPAKIEIVQNLSQAKLPGRAI